MKSRVFAIVLVGALGLTGCTSGNGRSAGQEIPRVSLEEPVSTPYGPVSLVKVSKSDNQYFDDEGNQVDRDEYVLSLDLLNESGEILTNICNGDPIWISEENQEGEDITKRPVTRMACEPAELDRSYLWQSVVPATGKEQQVYLMAADSTTGKAVTEGIFVFGPSDVTTGQ